MSTTEHPLTILIVDDNKNNLLTLRILIEEYIKDIYVREADSGTIALNIVMKNKIDLIILDVHMPGMDGFETARTIRSWEKMKYIPIVFLTAAYNSEEFQQKGFDIGATDYLTKPIDTLQLISRIKSYLRFIKQEQRYHQELECRVEERTQELSKINQQLQQAKQIAETANLAKSRFLANISHELRTPLNAIIGYAEMLQEYAADTHQPECSADLQKILFASKHLLGLINDLLDLSKIEADKMELRYETFNLAGLINEVAQMIQPLMEKNRNVFQVSYSHLPQEMFADLTKVRQILLNLLSNAAKFTDHGQIILEVSSLHEGNWVSFRLHDTGIGMTSEQTEQLFQPFSQGDPSTTRRYGGVGLGLVLTKKFIEMMGGKFLVESQPYQGTTFWVNLPLHHSSSSNLE